MSIPAWIRAEPYECWFSLMGSRYRGDFVMVLEFDGVIDADRLDRAVRSAIAAEPIWGYRFVEQWFYPYWRPSTAAELRSLVTIREVDNLQAGLHAELLQPVEAAARITILRRPAGDTLLVRIDHRRGDFTSGKLLLDEIRRRYQQDSPAPIADYIGPVVHRTIRLLRTVTPVERQKQYLRELKQIQKRESRQLAFSAPPVTKDDPYSSLRLLRYGPGSFEELTSRAFRERATPSLVLQAATYLALRDILDLSKEFPVPIVTNVDLRRYLPKELHPVHAANLVGDAVVEIPLSETADFSGVLGQVREQLQQQRGPEFGIVRSNHPLDVGRVLRRTSWVPYGLLRRVVRRVYDLKPGTPRVAVTDLGTIGATDETWGSARLTGGYATLGICHLPAVYVALTPCGSRVTLLTGFGPVSFVRQLTDRVDFHLCRFVGWTPGTAPREVIEPAP